MKFTEFCITNGIKLLRDDIHYLRKHLANLPDEPRKRVLRLYADEWLSGMNEGLNVLLKQNMGRRRANLALVEIINSIMNVNNQKIKNRHEDGLQESCQD